MRRVLVVERDEALRRLLRDVLARTGIEVDAVSEAPDAVARMAEERYGVLVVDIEPGDQSAGEVFRAVQVLEPRHRPIVLVTGERDSGVHIGAAIARLPVHKPYDVTALAAAIAASMGAGSAVIEGATEDRPVC
jgi:DNA-binding response OmpR family regulator